MKLIPFTTKKNNILTLAKKRPRSCSQHCLSDFKRLFLLSFFFFLPCLNRNHKNQSPPIKQPPPPQTTTILCNMCETSPETTTTKNLLRARHHQKMNIKPTPLKQKIFTTNHPSTGLRNQNKTKKKTRKNQFSWRSLAPWQLLPWVSKLFVLTTPPVPTPQRNKIHSHFFVYDFVLFACCFVPRKNINLQICPITRTHLVVNLTDGRNLHVCVCGF